MAKPFRFKLQSVLDYRAQLEDQARLALAQARRRYRAQSNKVAELQLRLVETEAEFRRRDELSSAEVWLWQSCRDSLTRDLEAAQRLLQKLAKELQNARQHAIQRSKERKLLEKLKENQAEQHVKEDALAQQKEFDETATLRFQHPDISGA